MFLSKACGPSRMETGRGSETPISLGCTGRRILEGGRAGQRVKKEGMREVKVPSANPRLILPGLNTDFAPFSIFTHVQGRL